MLIGQTLKNSNLTERKEFEKLSATLFSSIIGCLNSLKEYFTAADVRHAIRIGACNIYHGCMHNMVHEKSWEFLEGLYKSSAFTLQAAGFLQTDKYERCRKDLLNHLLPNGSSYFADWSNT